MFTYTFSKREKALLVMLAVLAIVILWYRFVFSAIHEQIAAIDSQIATVQDEMVVSQAQVSSLNNMRSVVEDYQAQGIAPVLLPSFDNTQNLMAFLHGVLAGTRNYSISFDMPALNEGDGTIHRTGAVSFDVGSYAEARSVTEAIARGPYPCTIDSLGIMGSANRSSGGSFTVNARVTFFENAASESDGGNGGNGAS